MGSAWRDPGIARNRLLAQRDDLGGRLASWRPGRWRAAVAVRCMRPRCAGRLRRAPRFSPAGRRGSAVARTPARCRTVGRRPVNGRSVRCGLPRGRLAPALGGRWPGVDRRPIGHGMEHGSRGTPLLRRRRAGSLRCGWRRPGLGRPRRRSLWRQGFGSLLGARNEPGWGGHLIASRRNGGRERLILKAGLRADGRRSADRQVAGRLAAEVTKKFGEAAARGGRRRLRLGGAGAVAGGHRGEGGAMLARALAGGQGGGDGATGGERVRRSGRPFGKGEKRVRSACGIPTGTGGGLRRERHGSASSVRVCLAFSPNAEPSGLTAG
jgi:hypothetical protein